MTAFQALKNPLLLAGREIVFAGGSVYATYTMATSGFHYIKNHIDSSKRHDFPSLAKIAVGADAICASMSIVVYAGLSKLTLQPGAKLYPILSQRPPLPIHQTIAVASMAFVLCPIACVFLNLVSEPLIELCHNVDEDVIGSKKGTEIEPTFQGRTSSNVAAASVEQVPLTRDKLLQVSVGTKMGPLMEAEVPGSITIVTPLAEEIFFRGQLFSRLIPYLGCIPAALTSSVLFGVYHRGYQGSVYFPITEAMIGLVCSLLYFRTGRLLVPFAFHSGVNVVAVAGSAYSSCQMKIFDKYYCATNPEACPVNPPELSFWEQRVAKNWSSIKDCLFKLVTTFDDKAASHDGPFLPLDFFGTAEMASKESIFYDHQHDGMLTAPSLCNADGTPSTFANFLMDVAVDQLFGDNDSIAIDRLIQYTYVETQLEVILHILATRPAHAESSGLLHSTMNASPLELADKMKDLMDQSQLEHFLNAFRRAAGIMLLEFPLENITRSEYESWYKKSFADCLRLGIYADLSQGLFIIYCLDAATRSSSISELLSGYCDLAAFIQKQEPEWYNEWAKAERKERTRGGGS